MKKNLFFLIIALLPLLSLAQESKQQFGIRFSGFVKNDFILDSYQTVSAREGHFLLYPKQELLDELGNDINDRSSFNYLSIQTRLKGTITGPDAFGAKTSGVIEGAFFGHTNSDINGFRLRHAFVKLDWGKTVLLTGQYWHMMFVPECFPGTVSFNTGVPFQYFTRNPQIRVTQQIGAFKFAGAVATQRDFTSSGGSQVLSNSLLPDMQGQIQYVGKSVLLGTTLGYKRLLPRLVTEENYKTSEGIGGITANAFAKISSKPLTLKFQAAYAQNGYDGLLIGGYAVRAVTDVSRDFREYTTVNTFTSWADIHTNGKSVQAGIYLGYSKNLGASDAIEANAIQYYGQYSRGSNIEYLYRIAPRILLNSGKVRVAGEIEHTAAAYGKTLSSKMKPSDSNISSNTRFLVAVYYFF